MLCNLLAIRAQSFWLLQLLFVMFYNNKIVSRIFQVCLMIWSLADLHQEMKTNGYLSLYRARCSAVTGIVNSGIGAFRSSLFRRVVLPEGPIS